MNIPVALFASVIVFFVIPFISFMMPLFVPAAVSLLGEKNRRITILRVVLVPLTFLAVLVH
jgi:hypothetical protein